ncbi:WD40 repeat-like protein, partial [Aureobasidium melanogenum]
MSSFFTKPASLKRKRPEGGAPRPQRTNDRSNARPTKRRETRDDSVSGSDFDDDDDLGPRPPADSDDESSESEFEGEDAAGRRTRLAERYLENTRQQIISEGFDAKDIDAELLAERMGERLKEDSAESKGKIYRWIADDYDYQNALHSQFRADSQTLTGVATCAPYIYTVSKDMTLIKWEMPQKIDASSKHTQPTKPKKLIYTRGNGKREDDFDFKHHTDAILCVAASSDGKFVATGGRDRKLIVWDAATLTPLKFFHHHRDAVTSLCFRRTTNQLYSASKDRTIKLWSLDELAYVETLFGHQDEVTDVAALNQELCVTVGARDRTARYWRVVEESQLVFRGGGSGASSKQRKENAAAGIPQPREFHEGSIDRVTMVDDEHFVTGSDNGTLSLWNIQKKKSVFTLPL